MGDIGTNCHMIGPFEPCASQTVQYVHTVLAWYVNWYRAQQLAGSILMA